MGARFFRLRGLDERVKIGRVLDRANVARHVRLRPSLLGFQLLAESLAVLRSLVYAALFGLVATAIAILGG